MVLESIYLYEDITNELVAVTEAYNKHQHGSHEEMTFQEMAEMILKDGIKRKYNMLPSWEKGGRYND